MLGGVDSRDRHQDLKGGSLGWASIRRSNSIVFRALTRHHGAQHGATVGRRRSRPCFSSGWGCNYPQAQICFKVTSVRPGSQPFHLSRSVRRSLEFGQLLRAEPCEQASQKGVENDAVGDDGNGVVDVAVEASKDGGDEVIVDEALGPRLHGILALGFDPASRF